MSLLRVALLLLVLGITSAPAQAQVDLAGIGGVYAPTSDFVAPFLANPFGVSAGKHQTALAYGGLARVWVDRRFGLEATILRTNSKVGVSSTFSTAPDTAVAAHLTLGTVSAVLRFPLGSSDNPVWASAGAAFVSRGGAAYRSLRHTSSLGGAVGIGTRFPLSRVVGVEIGLKSLLYSLSLRDSTGTLPSHFQIDFTAWAGVGLRFGRRHGVE